MPVPSRFPVHVPSRFPVHVPSRLPVHVAARLPSHLPGALATVAGAVGALVYVLLAPLEWVISSVLVAAHAALTAAGLPAASGPAWAASVAVLVVLVRLVLLPLTVRQARSAQRLAGLRREGAVVHAGAGASPLGCLPGLAQAPVLLALFRVLDAAAHGHAVAALGPALAAQVGAASLWGVALSDAARTGGSATLVAAALTVVMATTLWAGQHRQLTRNTAPAALQGPAGRSQRLGLWVLPVVTATSGLTFPVGVLLYWACTNTWSLAQQLAVIRWFPVPGSPAHAARLVRTTPAPGARPGAGAPGPTGTTLPRRGQRRRPRRPARRDHGW